MSVSGRQQIVELMPMPGAEYRKIRFSNVEFFAKVFRKRCPPVVGRTCNELI
jgi:hypothetical protein